MLKSPGYKLTYQERTFEEYEYLGQKAEQEFVLMMSIHYQVAVIRNAKHIAEVDYHNKQKTEYYEAKRACKIPDAIFMERILPGMRYPIVLDVGKLEKYVRFLQTTQAPVHLFLFCGFPYDVWRQKNGLYRQDLRILIGHYQKARTAGMESGKNGFYYRQIREDEGQTGKGNPWKWHIELDNFSQVIQYDPGFMWKPEKTKRYRPRSAGRYGNY